MLYANKLKWGLIKLIEIFKIIWILCKCHFEFLKLTLSSVSIALKKKTNHKECIKSYNFF
jgi:hypothetical protein